MESVVNILSATFSLGILGLIFGIGLGAASKAFAVEEDARVSRIREVLPGANCGGCGYPGCDACASAIVSGEAPVDACPVGGAKVAKKVAEIMGADVDAVEEKERMVAFVKCSGSSKYRKAREQYVGAKDCAEAKTMENPDSKDCKYGCLGLGSCTKVCKFGAISVVDGVAVVDEEKCTGCGSCVKACPKVIIEMVPVSKKVRVACSSNDRGKAVKDVCGIGCIGCTLCVKACQFGAIKFENNLAKVDYDKCTQCMACVKKCPSKVILGQVEAAAAAE